MPPCNLLLYKQFAKDYIDTFDDVRIEELCLSMQAMEKRINQSMKQGVEIPVVNIIIFEYLKVGVSEALASKKTIKTKRVTD